MDELETEADTSSGQDSGNWLATLLQTGVGAYSAITQARTTAANEKLRAQLAVPSVAQPQMNSGISNQTLMIVGGAAALGLVLILVLKK